jgi:putative Ca2+/H+ antiporter (TMEM165/GDT1 family)
MDWQLFFVTFGAIFLAEMGDKTQLAAMTMSANSGKPWIVIFAASLALAAVSAVGVAVGGALGAYLPTSWINRAAGCLFIAIGVFMLVGKS